MKVFSMPNLHYEATISFANSCELPEATKGMFN